MSNGVAISVSLSVQLCEISAIMDQDYKSSASTPDASKQYQYLRTEFRSSEKYFSLE